MSRERARRERRGAWRLTALGAGLALLASGLGSVATAVSTAAPAAAAIEDTRCVVEPATSTGTQSGVTAVAVGEQVRVGTEVPFDEGVIYQDVLANPDGSIYYASWLGVAPPADSALVADLDSITLTIDGVEQTLTPGTEPIPTGFVLDASVSPIRVYFPGDTEAMLAEPTGTGLPSHTVPEGGQVFRLTYLATVPETLAPGEATPAIFCQGAISLGDSNETISARTASVAVLGLDVRLAKSASVPVLAPSTTVTYSVDVSVPAFDDTGQIRNGNAYDTVVTDDIPDGLEYVDGSASHGGVESGGVITWTIPEIAAGEAVTLTYQLSVPADAEIGATFTNTVDATTTSLPGDVDGEREFVADPDSVTLTNGAEAPEIDKSANVAIAGTGQTVTYTTEITWPAGSTWHDVTITDLLPDGTTLVNPATSFTCAPDACPPFDTLAPFTDTGGRTRFGHYVAQVGPFAAEQTWTWTYTVQMVGSFANGTPVPLGTELDNIAEVRFNLIPRLGGVVPNPARLVEYDGLVGDTAPVTFNRPVIGIEKAGPDPSEIELSPEGVTYTVTLTNTGGVNATNVAFTDPAPLSADGRRLGTILPASVTDATFDAGTGTFTVASVPANDTATVTYRVVGSATHPVVSDADYVNVATVTTYRDAANNVYPVSVPADATVSVVHPLLEVDKERLSASPIAGTDGETVSYRITITNTGDATAYDVSGDDSSPFTGTLDPGTCTGGMSITAAGEIEIEELAPTESASCEYEIELDGDQAAGPYQNTVTVDWHNGFGQTGVWDDAAGVAVPFSATDTVTTNVVKPALAILKSPDADTPGNTITNGQTSSYTIQLTNVGQVTALDVELSDVLPDGLTLEGEPIVDTNPDGITNTVDGDPGDDGFTITFPTLPTGASAQVTVPVRHDGEVPAEDEIVNTATLSADGVAEPLEDTGTLLWVPNVVVPVVDKAVDPASAGIGETVTWTVTATVRENIVDLYDVAFVDTIPDGLVLDGYGAVTCDSGPLCATVPSPQPLLPAVLATGETRIGWFVGDVPIGTGDTTYTFTFTTTVAEEYTGTGSPPAGTDVTNTTLQNRVQPWFTINPDLDRYDDGTFPALAPSLTTQFERRGAPALEPVDVTTPAVTAEKEVTNRGPLFEWDTADAQGAGWTASAGDEVAYEVTFTNTGGATAFDVVATDRAGETLLRDVEVAALPAGVTVIDGWSLADPDIVFQIDELDDGESVVVTYTGVVAPSEELVPGFSGDNRDLALIDNVVTVDEFRSAPDGGGRLFEDTATASAEVYVYTPSPIIPGMAACIGSPTAAPGTIGTVTVITRNGAPPAGETSGTLLTTGFPPAPDIGAGHDAILTVVLSPNLRYVEGSAVSGSDALPDPETSLDTGTSVQTLVFDLGDVPQNTTIPVAFDVSTVGFGVQGGARATLTMDDASGSPSRGTAVPGAAYVYQHAQSRGCATPASLGIRKFPDQSSNYTGQKTFEVGETVTWFGSVFGTAAPFHDGELVDTMPAGIDYTPGTAVFNVVPGGGGPAVVASVPNGNLTETITPLPDGRTEIRFTSPLFAEFQSLNYTIPSAVAGDAIIGATLTNVIELIISDAEGGACANPLAAVCDNGQARIISSADPTISKSVDHEAGPWGDTFTYTIDVALPADLPMFDAFIADRSDFPRSIDPDSDPFANATIECLSGCGSDPVPPVALPAFSADVPDPDPDELARGWYLGDLATSTEERVYRITYEQPFVDVAQYEAEFGESPLSEEYLNEAVTGWNDADVLTDANFQPGGPQHTPASSRSFGFNPEARGIDDAVVTLLRPELAVEKTCEALDGTDDPASSTSTGGETTGSVPNFRCVLTATNATDEALGATVVDPAFRDTLPTVSDPGDRSVTAQVITTTPSDPLLDIVVTEDPASPLIPPAATQIDATGEGIELAPGESVSVTVDLRITADDAFWDDGDLSQERGVNTVTADSFGDTLGNAYEGDSTDSWNLVIAKPALTVSERAFAAGEYDGSLSDPTACMAYRVKPNPLQSGRVAGAIAGNACSAFQHARLHESAPGGQYARAYGGYGYGAPDVVPGATGNVTWAVDVAVVNPEAYASLSVADEIPYGFAYVPGSARLAQWSEAGTTHTPLADPVVGVTPAVTCGTAPSFSNVAGTGTGEFHHYGTSFGQAPWTPLTWTFADGAPGAAGAFWDDTLTYLNEGNRDAAGATPNATEFDRMVRVVFDVQPTAEFSACAQQQHAGGSFRSRVTASGVHTRGTATSEALGWVVGVDLAHVEKTPDAAIAPDGSTATYDLDVTITDPTRLHTSDGSASPNTVPARIPGSGGICSANPAIPAPLPTPWVGLGDLDRNGTSLRAIYSGTSHGDFSSELVVTDTLVDDGRYVPGSAAFEMLDPWGRPFAGHLASEEVENVTVDGRMASRITWTFDAYPSPLNMTNHIGVFPCLSDFTPYYTFPSSLNISLPLDIPDGTPDGTLHPNTAQVTANHYDGGSLVRSQGDADDALVTVRNPSPPPPAEKFAVPDEVAPGQTFDWVLEAELPANQVWLDLGWNDTIPANMELVEYGDRACVVTGTTDPCGPDFDPTLLQPVINGDGSTTVGWFLGDQLGSPQSRTIQLPITVRFIGDEVADDTLTNSATGFSNEDDTHDTIETPPDPSTFAFTTDVAGTATVVEPDLAIEKVITNGPGPFQAGSTVDYEIRVTNNGGATAYDVEVSDTPDFFLRDVTSSSPFTSKGWTLDDPRVEWFLPTIGAGETVTLPLTGTVDAGYAAAGVRLLENTSTIPGYTSRPVTEEDAREYGAEQAIAAAPLVAQNLVVDKSAGADCALPAQTFTPGEPVTWCIEFANTGDAPAHNVTVTDVLPPGWTYDAGSALVDGVAVEPAVQSSPSGVRLVWTIGEVAPDAQTHEITYRTIGSDGPNVVENTAIVDSTLADGTVLEDPPEGFRSRDTAQAVQLNAGLQIAKLPNLQRFECSEADGCLVTWQIVAVNADELDLTSATVTDFLPAGLTYESSTTPAGWNPAVVGIPGDGPGGTTTVTWTHTGTFASTEVASFDLTARIPADAAEREYLNHVEASADEVPTAENQALAEVFSFASLGDFVWEDLDSDGQQAGNEPGIAGVTVQLLDDEDEVIATDVTDVDGFYLFENLEPGTYRVRVLVPDGYIVSPQDEGDDASDSDVDDEGFTTTIDLASGEDDLTWDAGLFTVIEQWTSVKTSDTDGPVEPGDTVTYELIVTNTGNVPVTATAEDDLSEVLDDATYNEDADDDGHDGTLEYDEPVLSWTGELDPDEDVVITYSVTVGEADDLGDGRLQNAVTETTNCPAPAITDPESPDFDEDCVVVDDIEAWSATKTSDARNRVRPGDVIIYTVEVENTGNVPVTGASLDDDLTEVLDDAVYNDDADDGDHPGAFTYTEPELTWTGDLVIDETVTLTYSVTVGEAGELGDGRLQNALTGPLNCPDPAVTDPENEEFDAECVVIDDIAAWTAEKTSDADDPVLPGDTIEYTVTLTNTGNLPVPGIAADILPGALDDATYNDDADDDGHPGTLVFASGALTWAGTLAVGDVVTITYSITVNEADDLGDGRLVNAVVGSPNCGFPPVTDPQSPDFNSECVVIDDVEAWTSTKTSDLEERAFPGDVVNYTITVENTGNVLITGASVDDDLSDVLDDAIYNDDADAGGVGMLSYGEPVLSWTGDLAVDQVVTITYSVMVHAAEELGDGQLRNAVTGAPSCPEEPITDPQHEDFDADCARLLSVRSFTVEKTSDADNRVLPGEVVNYTITVVNDGPVPWEEPNAAELEDDLSDVLDDATLDPASLSATRGNAQLDGSTLRWRGELGVGEDAVITYSVTVGDPPGGNYVLENVVTSNGPSCNVPTSEARLTPEQFAPGCGTITLVAAARYEKTLVVPAEGNEVDPGGTVTYQVTVTNFGPNPMTGLTFVDDLSDLLEHATFLNDATATIGTVSYAEPRLSWTGDLDAGQESVVRYSLAVDGDVAAGTELRNAVAGSGPGSNCDPGAPAEPPCVVVLVVAGAGGGGLAFTGFGASTLAVLGLCFLLAGLVVVAGTRRRRRASRPTV